MAGHPTAGPWVAIRCSRWPANPEQRQIIDRLRTDNGVVVLGPPGTGKRL